MAFSEQEHPFVAIDRGEKPIDLRYLGTFNIYRPTKIIHKSDGASDEGASFCIIMENPIYAPVAGEISLKMLNKALSTIGYKIKKKKKKKK